MKMLFQFSSLIVLTALSFLSHASTSVAGHARPHHHLHRTPMAFGDATLSASKLRRSNPGSIDVPLNELHQLQSETTAFQQWMNTWLGYETTTDTSPAIALARQEIQSYDGWINAWLDSVLNGGAPPPPLPSSIPLGASRFRRSNPGSIEVPLTDLNQLRSETAAFQQWMSAWLDSETATDTSPAIVLLRQEIQAYKGWINAWLDSAMSVGGAPPPPLPSSIPVTLPVGSSLLLSSVLSDLATASSSSLVVVVTPPATSAPPTDQSFQTPTPSTQASSNDSDDNLPSQTSFVTVASPKPTQPPIPTSSTVTSVPTAATPIASDSQSASADIVPSASAPAPSQPGSSSGSGQFDAQSSKNVAVYYGQTDATAKVSLGEMCQSGNVDIVVLAFLTDFFGPGGFPSVNFGAACTGQTPQMQSAGATGLLSCPDMASQIQQCQGLGKKVLLSLGGSLATSEFPDDSKATEFANTLWDLFGAGTGVDADLRPFGDVRIDGFDVDNEDHKTFGYSTFVSSLRKAMNADSSKTYYISAAPQCIRPDASIPLDAMQTMDFIFVQFYNNPACNLGGPGFVDSFKAWSSDLSANGAGPKLYIGSPGCVGCASTGYLDPATMASTFASANEAGISNFGGIMLWDGPMAMENVQDGKDYTAVVKDVLV